MARLRLEPEAAPLSQARLGGGETVQRHSSRKPSHEAYCLVSNPHTSTLTRFPPGIPGEPDPEQWSSWHPQVFLLAAYTQKPSSQLLLNSVQFSCSVVSNSLRPHGLQHARPSCLSPTPRAYSNSCPSRRWYHPAISCSVIPFSCLQCFLTSKSFPMSQLFTSSSQSIGASPSTSVLPMNSQDWSPLGWTGWIPLQSKGLSGVFSSTTVQKHQFFSAQLSLLSSSHIHTWLLGKKKNNNNAVKFKQFLIFNKICLVIIL